MSWFRSSKYLAAAVTIAWLAGCGGFQTVVQAPVQSGSTASASQRSAARPSGPRLYVGGSNISEYVLGHTHPLHSVSADYDAEAMAADSLGNLFVISVYGSSDRVVRILDARTLKTRPSPGSFGVSIAVDSNNYLYLREYGKITVFSPGGTHALYQIHKWVDWIGRIAFDRYGYLYVANISTVTVFAPTSRPGYLKFERKITDGIASPNALAFGPADELFVANCRRCPYSHPGKRKDWISVYARNASIPLRRFYDGADGKKEPRALAVDSKGRLYVANPNFGRAGPPHGGGVDVYEAGGSIPVKTITHGIDIPIGLAIDSSDELYVANWYGGRVTVYSPGGRQLLETIKNGANAPQALLISSP